MINTEIYKCLQHDLNSYLSSQELEMLISHNKIFSYAPGQMILQQGKYSQGIYLIIRGTVMVTAKLLGEGTSHLETLEHGCFLGEASFIENIPCPTSMIANTDVECIVLTKTYFEFLATYHPEVKYHLFTAIAKQVCGRIRRVHNKIINFMTTSEMTTRPLFGEIIQSLTKPSEITNKEERATELNQLKQFMIFHNYEKAEILELLNHSILLKAPKNCTLIHKGEINASSYIVIHGAVQSSIVHANKVAKLSVIGPATLFTSIACADTDSSYTITFTTCEQSILLKIPETDLNFIKENHAFIWYKLFDLICISLVALEKSVDKLDIRLNIETYNR